VFMTIDANYQLRLQDVKHAFVDKHDVVFRWETKTRDHKYFEESRRVQLKSSARTGRHPELHSTQKTFLL